VRTLARSSPGTGRTIRLAICANWQTRSQSSRWTPRKMIAEAGLELCIEKEISRDPEEIYNSMCSRYAGNSMRVLHVSCQPANRLQYRVAQSLVLHALNEGRLET
jgi:hypothetical protein